MISIKRFGLPYNPRKEKKRKDKIIKHIIAFLVIFILVAALSAVGFSILLRKYIGCMAISDMIDSIWIGSLASYWGGIIGGVFSGIFAFLGVFYTIKYYKESDERKEKAAIQPFLFVAVGNNKDVQKGFELGPQSSSKVAKKRFNIAIKNIGNGFANTLVIYTGFNAGGMAYNHVITVGETKETYFMINTDDLRGGINFGIQYIDAMRNEYIQEYIIMERSGQINIECGYPKFIDEK